MRQDGIVAKRHDAQHVIHAAVETLPCFHFYPYRLIKRVTVLKRVLRHICVEKLTDACTAAR